MADGHLDGASCHGTWSEWIQNAPNTPPSKPRLNQPISVECTSGSGPRAHVTQGGKMRAGFWWTCGKEIMEGLGGSWPFQNHAPRDHRGVEALDPDGSLECGACCDGNACQAFSCFLSSTATIESSCVHFSRKYTHRMGPFGPPSGQLFAWAQEALAHRLAFPKPGEGQPHQCFCDPR